MLEIKTAPVFLEDSLPEISPQGVVYKHALHLDPKCAHDMWMEGVSIKDKLLRGYPDDRHSNQIIIFQRNPEINDVTTSLLNYPSLRDLTSHPIVTVDSSLEFPNHEPKNESPALVPRVKSIYGVASIVTERDLFSVIAAADRCKDELGAKCFTLVCSFLAGARQDKNVDKSGKYEPHAINIKAAVKILSTVVDRMIVAEPHSSATQAFAAMRKMPLLPLSLWKVMADEVKEKGVRTTGGFRVPLDKDNAVIIGPDEGRNTASRRISDYLKIPRFAYNKKRLTDTQVTISDNGENHGVDPENRICLIYDDIIASGGTLGKIADDLQYRRRAKTLAGLFAHTELVGQWAHTINDPFIANIFATNSRKPLEDINPYGKTNWIDLSPWIYEIIKKDMQGEDPYLVDPLVSEVL